MTKKTKATFGRNELRAAIRVTLLAALFTVPFVLNHTAQADVGASSMSGAGFVLYVSVTRPRG